MQGASLMPAVNLLDNPGKCVLSAPFAAISLSKAGERDEVRWGGGGGERREGGSEKLSLLISQPVPLSSS